MTSSTPCQVAGWYDMAMHRQALITGTKVDLSTVWQWRHNVNQRLPRIECRNMSIQSLSGRNAVNVIICSLNNRGFIEGRWVVSMNTNSHHQDM